MKIFKMFLFSVLVLTMIFSFVGCAKEKENTKKNETAVSEETITESKNNDDTTASQTISNLTDVKINIPDLPTEVSQKSGSETVSKFKFTRINYTSYDIGGNQVSLKFRYTAKKTFDSISDANKTKCAFTVNLVDDKTGGIVFTDNLTTDEKAVGEKCENYGFEIICPKTNGSYTLQIV